MELRREFDLNGFPAGLLARAGTDELFVGASKTLDRKERRLFLGINDCTLKGNFHNTGLFNATVKVARNVIRWTAAGRV